MIRHITMSDEQARAAIKAGDIPEDVRAAADNVILVLTQSWCPQWMFMKISLKGLGKGPEDMDVAVVVFEYDRSPEFNSFMAFKENTFRNWEVPYVRLYKGGNFLADGNHFPASRMIETLRKG